jgi:hypothetical protein
MIEELDLRKELIELFTGEDFGNEKKIPYILRRARRKENLLPVRCPACWNEVSKEGRQGCSDCDGLGFLWDETIINGFMYFISKNNTVRSYDYSSEAGRSEKYGIGLITDYTGVILNGDMIYLPRMTASGAILTPIILEEEYLTINTKKYRLDNNKLEFNSIILTRVK